jgi:hypothetical protein
MIEYSVEIQPDFLEKQTKAHPIAAVAELIWNGLDADATAVTVDLEDDHLGSSVADGSAMSSSGSHATLRWREMDSNFQFRCVRRS